MMAASVINWSPALLSFKSLSILMATFFPLYSPNHTSVWYDTVKGTKQLIKGHLTSKFSLPNLTFLDYFILLYGPASFLKISSADCHGHTICLVDWLLEPATQPISLLLIMLWYDNNTMNVI